MVPSEYQCVRYQLEVRTAVFQFIVLTDFVRRCAVLHLSVNCCNLYDFVMVDSVVASGLGHH